MNDFVADAITGQMYDNMTTYMLAESPESGSHHQAGSGGGHSSSNAPSLIGSPRSTPVFNGHALKVLSSIFYRSLSLDTTI